MMDPKYNSKDDHWPPPGEQGPQADADAQASGYRREAGVDERIARLQAENKHLRGEVAKLITFRDALLEITQDALAERARKLEQP